MAGDQPIRPPSVTHWSWAPRWIPVSGAVVKDPFQLPSKLMAAEGRGKTIPTVSAQQRPNPPQLQSPEQNACHHEAEGGRVELHQSQT